MKSRQQEIEGVKVWDLPTRVFHWSLVLCVIFAVTSAQIGGNWMDWHLRFGIATLALLVFRLIWGLFGPRYARFRSFLYSPLAVWRHLRLIHRDAVKHAGHSPSGAASVLGLLTVLLLQVGSGLFSSDSISVEGPLAKWVGDGTIERMTWVHLQLQWLLYGLVLLHCLAILFYWLVKQDNLLWPMISGVKQDLQAPATNDTGRVRMLGLGLMLGLLGMFFWFFG